MNRTFSTNTNSRTSALATYQKKKEKHFKPIDFAERAKMQVIREVFSHKKKGFVFL